MKDNLDRFHKFTLGELLGAIDHKVRGVQQVIISLRTILEDESVDDIMEETKDIQKIYVNYLNLRRLNLVEVRAEQLIKEEFGIIMKISGYVELDREKMKYIFNTLEDFCGSKPEICKSPDEEKLTVEFSSERIEMVDIRTLKYPPEDIELLPLFAVNKIASRMGINVQFKYNLIVLTFNLLKKEKL